MTDLPQHLAIAGAAIATFVAVLGPLRAVRGNGAHRRTIVVFGLAPGALWATAELAYADVVPEPLVLVPAAICLSLILCQDCAVRATGGYRRVALLGREAMAITRLAIQLYQTSSEVNNQGTAKELQKHLHRLGRLRYSASSSEYIDLLTELAQSLVTRVAVVDEAKKLARLNELEVGFEREIETFAASPELRWWASSARQRTAAQRWSR